MDIDAIKRSRDAAWVYSTFDLYDPDCKLYKANWPTLNDWVALELNKNVYIVGGEIKYEDIIEVCDRLAGIDPRSWVVPKWLPNFVKRSIHKKQYAILETNKQIILEIFNLSFNDWPKKSAEQTEENKNDAQKAPESSAIGLVPAIALPLVKMTGLNILQIANLPIRVISQLIRIDRGITEAPETTEWVANMLLQLNSNNKKG